MTLGAGVVLMVIGGSALTVFSMRQAPRAGTSKVKYFDFTWTNGFLGASPAPGLAEMFVAMLGGITLAH